MERKTIGRPVRDRMTDVEHILHGSRYDVRVSVCRRRPAYVLRSVIGLVYAELPMSAAIYGKMRDGNAKFEAMAADNLVHLALNEYQNHRTPWPYGPEGKGWANVCDGIVRGASVHFYEGQGGDDG